MRPCKAMGPASPVPALLRLVPVLFVALLASPAAIYAAASSAASASSAGASAGAGAAASAHLEAARVLMGAGKFYEALDKFEAAIGADPSSHMAYFKRAAAYLTLGRYPQALSDFSKVLELKPGHMQARMQKAKILLLDGSIDAAVAEARMLPSNNAETDSAKLVADITQASSLFSESTRMLNAKNCQGAIEPLNGLIGLSPLSFDLRVARGDCFLELGDKEMAINDYKRCVKIKPDRTTLYIKLASLHLSLGETAESLTNAKECLRLDPDQKECKRHFRRLKKLEKGLSRLDANAEKNKWRDVIAQLFGEDELNAEIDAIGAQQLKIKAYTHACKAYSGLRKDVEAITWCSKVLELDRDNVDALVARGEAYTNKEDFHEAIGDFQRAYELNRNDPRIVEGYNKAQKLLKRAGIRDYYKILAVRRDASQREIKKAFRKLAQEWHPDKYSGDLTPEQVQKKMSEINQAYEVLSNEELRARYDNGDDPNDPHQGREGGNPFGGAQFFQGGGGGFPGGGFQFGGGGGGFTFRFQ
ncbi:hypothetical protein BC831DRAFT_456653 [Entophlyctis helioformis]|nr:hypothetical protein BC831DRAFT_456653 [Entophlyctis helioformis]